MIDPMLYLFASMVVAIVLAGIIDLIVSKLSPRFIKKFKPRDRLTRRRISSPRKDRSEE